MGFDKPDLGFVVHFQRPGSVVAYYQQVGRAGRAVESAFGILLSGREDDEIQDYFIRTAFPPLEVMRQVLRVLEKNAALTLDEIAAQMNFSRNALEKALKLLEVDGAVAKEKRGYSRTPNLWQADAQRFEQVTQHRRRELQEMKDYVEHPGCLMEFLARALDDPTAAPCGKCMNCARQTTRRSPPVGLVQDAITFLRGADLILQPRERWPKPVLNQINARFPAAVELSENGGPKTTIPVHLRPEPGRVLCIYGDAGWGPEVAHGKYQTGEFSDQLVAAGARLIQEKWKPEPGPQWLTAVPSLRRTGLVAQFAERLADRLQLPFVDCVRKTAQKPPQKEMQNSIQQVRNVLEAFMVIEPLPAGAALLVDDVTDSGWTLTMVAVLLKLHGSGPVYPFALAKASPRGG